MNTLRDIAMTAGYAVSVEQPVPQWSGQHRSRDSADREARMDLVCWHAAYPTEHFVDVSLRNPLAPNTVMLAAKRDAWAIQEGIRAKEQTYPAKPSMHVTPAIFEAFGRMSEPLHDMLKLWCAKNEAPERKRSRSTGGAVYAQACYSLQVTLARCVAKTLRDATRGQALQSDSLAATPPPATGTLPESGRQPARNKHPGAASLPAGSHQSEAPAC